MNSTFPRPWLEKSNRLAARGVQRASIRHCHLHARGCRTRAYSPPSSCDYKAGWNYIGAVYTRVHTQHAPHRTAPASRFLRASDDSARGDAACDPEQLAGFSEVRTNYRGYQRSRGQTICQSRPPDYSRS